MEFEKILTDGSILYFTDGQTVKGAGAVGEVILECCKGYLKGYLQGVAIGAAIGIGVIASIQFVGKKIKKHKKNQIEEKVEEEA